ncbi:MAG: ATP-binding protein [Planctomycetota bacterium]
MFGISFNLISYTGMRIGPSIGVITPKGSPPAAELTELSIPWQNPTENPTVFALLSWHTTMADFAGRDEEISELYRWVTSNHPVSIKFLTGDGGVGKSRLAAHFANELRKKDWAAGFVNLRKAVKFPLNKDGSLLIVDYPEQNPSGVQELLCDLATLEQSEQIKLRVLFLSREPLQCWREVFRHANSLTLLDTSPVAIGGMYERPAYDIFCSAQEKTAEIFNTTPLPVSESDLIEWVNQAEKNQRALFIVAAAVQSSLHPEEDVFGYTGPEVIDALVEREIDRLRGVADTHRIKDKNSLARLLAMAAIAGELAPERISELAAMQELHLGLPKGDYLIEMLNETMLLSDGLVHPPEPDIVAAAFTVKVFAQNPKTAPELIWTCLIEDVEAGIERITRISYDAEILLGMYQNRISRYFATALKGHIDRCEILDEYFSKILPMTLLDASIMVWKTLLSVTDDVYKCSRLLNNLSTDLAQIGDKKGALEAILETVEIYRRLAKANPAEYEPDLARSLGVTGRVLRQDGKIAQSVGALREGIYLIKPFVEQYPQSPFFELLKVLEYDLIKSEEQST